MDAVSRSRADLQRQKSECLAAEERLADNEQQLKEMDGDWEDALAAGVISKPQYDTAKAQIDDMAKVLTDSTYFERLMQQVTLF